MMRAKMVCEAVVPQQHGGFQVTFRCQYDQSIPEDQRFTKATPWGMINMQIDNPEAVKQLVIGQAYYVDFSQVPAT